ncbi:hypothetical protein D9M71_610400 [compost metagenome]
MSQQARRARPRRFMDQQSANLAVAGQLAGEVVQQQVEELRHMRQGLPEGPAMHRGRAQHPRAADLHPPRILAVELVAEKRHDARRQLAVGSRRDARGWLAQQLHGNAGALQHLVRADASLVQGLQEILGELNGKTELFHGPHALLLSGSSGSGVANTLSHFAIFGHGWCSAGSPTLPWQLRVETGSP